MSQAYSAGFAAYLPNVLAADLDYDWAPLFSPSTPRFMINFKDKYAAEIVNAKTDLEAKIASELEALKNKEEVEGEETQGGKVAEPSVASPTETTAS